MGTVIHGTEVSVSNSLTSAARRVSRRAIGCAFFVTLCLGVPRLSASSTQPLGLDDGALPLLLEMSALRVDKDAVLRRDKMEVILGRWNLLLQRAATDPNAATLLGKTADRLWQECRRHAQDVNGMKAGWEDHLYALGHLGPVAFRMYLSAAGNPGFPRRTLASYGNGALSVIRACTLVLERRHQGLSAGTIQLALQITTAISKTVTPQDLATFRNMFLSTDNYVIGDASLRGTKAIGEVILDRTVDERTREVAMAALGAAFTAHEVFFRAMKSLVQEIYRAANNPLVKAAAATVGISPAQSMEKRLQDYVDSVRAEEFTSPSRIVAYCTALLASERTKTRVQGATALGHMVPSAIRFVDGVTGILVTVPMDVRPALGRNAFLIASSSFDAVFALADAAVGEDGELRQVASAALYRILDPNEANDGVLDPNAPNASMTSVVQNCVALLGARGQKQRSYSVENEAFNALLAIPLATRETIAQVKTREERTAGADVRGHAGRIRRLLTTLVETTAGKIVTEFGRDTDLYTARRYFLILRLYGETIPNRLKQYLDLLTNLAPMESTASIDLKRLAAREALDAFQTTKGSTQRGLVTKDQFERMRGRVEEIKNAYTGTGQEDQILRDYLEALDQRIVELTNESYGLLARAREWWDNLSLLGKGGLATTTMYLVVLVVVVAIWIVAPAQTTKWAMTDATREETPSSFKSIAEAVSWIRWLGCTTRALDAWLAKSHDQLLRQTFRVRQGNVGLRDEESDTVKRLRAYYTDLGNQTDVRRFCDLVRQRKPVALWVEGSGGGSGKTTLACHLAYEAMCKSKYPVLPVVMSRGWGESLLNGVTDLCMVGNRALRPAMVRNLARRGRILLIVDGLSEIGGHLNGDRKWFSNIIVTARHHPPGEGEPFRTVTVGSLNRKDTKKLDEFIRRYVRDKGVQTRAETLIGKLMDKSGGSSAAGDQRILPIFAYLAIDYVKRNPEQAEKAEPDSSLGLVLDYCKALRPRGPKALTDYSYWDAACAAAYAVVEERLSPRYVDRHVLRTALAMTARTTPFRDTSDNDVSPDDALLQLERSGLLAGPPGDSYQLATLYIGFRYDVVAEYLAAIHIKEQPEMVARVQRMREQASDFARILAEVQQATPYS